MKPPVIGIIRSVAGRAESAPAFRVRVRLRGSECIVLGLEIRRTKVMLEIDEGGDLSLPLDPRVPYVKGLSPSGEFYRDHEFSEDQPDYSSPALLEGCDGQSSPPYGIPSGVRAPEGFCFRQKIDLWIYALPFSSPPFLISIHVRHLPSRVRSTFPDFCSPNMVKCTERPGEPFVLFSRECGDGGGRPRLASREQFIDCINEPLGRPRRRPVRTWTFATESPVFRRQDSPDGRSL